jgi:O-acetyl-ADP-ribose deacetylase (regulator of RNase III)
MNNRIVLVEGDITTLHVDVVVNAANKSLLGGSGVDGAIHRAAGPLLLEACRILNGCETGRAKITKGYRLPAKFIIHAVGPVWQGGDSNEAELLAACYRSSLQLAIHNKCTSIAFPNISTGIFGYPKDMAATIAVNEVVAFLEEKVLLEKVIFCCFDTENFAIYNRILF